MFCEGMMEGMTKEGILTADCHFAPRNTNLTRQRWASRQRGDAI